MMETLRMVLSHLLHNYTETGAVILFAIGLTTLLFHRNLVKKIVGLGIMDTGCYLLLASSGFIEGRSAPILTDYTSEAVAGVSAARYINPIPAGLVLTGIVVSVSVTAVMLALTVRLYRRYGSLDLDEIYEMASAAVAAEEGFEVVPGIDASGKEEK